MAEIRNSKMEDPAFGFQKIVQHQKETTNKLKGLTNFAHMLQER